MASEHGQRKDPLIADLVDEPHRFSFFQAVRILEDYLGRGQGARTRGRIPVGDLQIRPNTSLGHPASDVHDIEILPPVDVDDESERFRITVNFMGLYGVDSPLPDFYLGDFARADDEESNPQRAFLDVFHQRLYWLLYLSWRKYRHYIEYEADNSDNFSLRLFALIGLADKSMRSRLKSAPQRLLPFSGVLSRRECSASALQSILARMLDVRVEIEEFRPNWIDIQPSQRQRLGFRNSRLGGDTTIGERICDIGSKFRLHIGPLSWNDYQDFLSGGNRRVELDALIGQVLSRPLAYDLRLMLAPTPCRSFVLGQGELCALGRSSWLAASENANTSVVFEGKN
mgnify:CR=1 FL=1